MKKMMYYVEHHLFDPDNSFDSEEAVCKKICDICDAQAELFIEKLSHEIIDCVWVNESEITN